MIITPEEKTNREIRSTHEYLCPTCQAQSTASKVEIGWVSCPMIGGGDICVGCCIDFQVVAHSEKFEDHPIFDDFLAVAKKYRKQPSKLRIICINHQIELHQELLKDKKPETANYNDVIDSLDSLMNLRSKI